MQTDIKSSSYKFTVKVLAVALCLTIGLSGHVAPARAVAPATTIIARARMLSN